MAYLFVAPLVPQVPIAKESGPKLLIPMYRVRMQKDILPPRTALSRQRMAIARAKRSAGKERHFGFSGVLFLRLFLQQSYRPLLVDQVAPTVFAGSRSPSNQIDGLCRCKRGIQGKQ